MKLKFLQEGGAMGMPAEDPNAAPAAAPTSGAEAQGGSEDPIMMLAEMAAQALQANDGEMALQVCQGFLELVQQMAQGGGEQEAAPQGEPVYRKGGKLAYVTRD